MRRRGSKQLTRPKATAALGSLLRDCRVEKLAEFTAEGLSSSYNVPLAKAADMLERARADRGIGGQLL